MTCTIWLQQLHQNQCAFLSCQEKTEIFPSVRIDEALSAENLWLSTERKHKQHLNFFHPPKLSARCADKTRDHAQPKLRKDLGSGCMDLRFFTQRPPYPFVDADRVCGGPDEFVLVFCQDDRFHRYDARWYIWGTCHGALRQRRPRIPKVRFF